ncbi:hypothetical protein F2Q70_00030179 [Brassica cretica]|uniref:Uncharacterized protein n=1 Tax=Brassica cretica TaxID=69181 RepID=A0A8S9FMG0_BRACR|nr:hypothetical protein F2Q70_00030179 [Brassica cretica]KAF3520314.1 hypothetical protein DY000_02060879 [Brassica cretica]
MKGQPVSQQSNKNMTDRPTQHHGPEALHDGLGTIRSKVIKFTLRPRPVCPLTRPANSRLKALQPTPDVNGSVRSRPKTSQPVPRPNVVLVRTKPISYWTVDF